MGCQPEYKGVRYKSVSDLKDALSKEKKLGGLKYAEVMLPGWSKEFFKDFVDINGNLDYEKAYKAAPEIMEMIGYRIPTEGKYSMLPMKVVGFLPIESGGAIMLPSEITTISGSDKQSMFE